MPYSSNPSEIDSKKYLQVVDKHIVGGAKRGRKTVDNKIFLKYKNDTTINQIDENICKKMTLKQLRQTALYKKLHYDPQGRLARAGKQGARFGNKSYLNKAQLCKYLNNPKQYEADLNKAYKISNRSGPRIRRTRAGDCIPKPRVPTNGKCKKNGEYKFTGKTSSGIKCCYKKKQGNKSSTRQKKTKSGNSELKATIKSVIKQNTNEVISYLSSAFGIETQNDLDRYLSSGNKFLKKLDKYNAKNPNTLKTVTFITVRSAIESLI